MLAGLDNRVGAVVARTGVKGSADVDHAGVDGDRNLGGG